MKKVFFYYFIMASLWTDQLMSVHVEKGVLDRVEGGQAVILLENREEEWVLPLEKEWKVGMIFRIDVHNNKIWVDKKRTIQQSLQIKALFHDLREQKKLKTRSSRLLKIKESSGRNSTAVEKSLKIKIGETK